MSGDEAMIAALGFTSFGPRHRARSRAKHIVSKKTNAHVLPQLMPGTELVGKYAELSGDSMEDGPHGVVYLLSKQIGSDGLLETALEEHIKTNTEVTEDEKHTVPYSAVLEKLEREKGKFNKFQSSHFLSARSAANAFETLGRHRFLNRSAMKLVTLDHIFQWTWSSKQRQESLSFADICGGPGEHSQYVHGYGITLKEAANNCDWRLPSAFSHVFNICYGEDGTGNLYSLANIHCFRDFVRARHSCGVDLVVADGGFLDARSQSNQELIMTRLILAETLAMFAVLRVGGDFVCKTFELTTPAMLQLCWLLHHCFGRFAIVKPITSRPASSERYIVARGLRASRSIPRLVRILEDQLALSSTNDVSDTSQHSVLPNSTPMRGDMDFHKYMKVANETIAMRQVQACRRVNEFFDNKNKRKLCEADTKIDPREYYQCWQLGSNPGRKFAQ